MNVRSKLKPPNKRLDFNKFDYLIKFILGVKSDFSEFITKMILHAIAKDTRPNQKMFDIHHNEHVPAYIPSAGLNNMYTYNNNLNYFHMSLITILDTCIS